MKVSPEYRTHPDSHVPGGTKVRIHILGEKEPREYDNIKRPQSYIDAAFRNRDDIYSVHLLRDGEWVLIYRLQ